MTRRITTGLVSIALANISEVAGPRCSAMWSMTWSTPDNLLSRLMKHHMLHDWAAVKTWVFRVGRARDGDASFGNPRPAYQLWR